MSLTALAALWLSGFLSKPIDWRAQVFYQIFPRSYRDSNGDRIGDFNGIRLGLPTIKGLGCTAILLNPIVQSRVYHNYFADDFYKPDPKFGSLRDFRELIRAAHAQGLKVVLDMEPQYVADHFPWLANALKKPKSKDAGYLWKEDGKGYMGGPWWYDGQSIRFAAINFKSAYVRSSVQGIFQFWANQGVDGFRLDHMMDDFDWKHVMTGLMRSFWTPLEEAVLKSHPKEFFVGEQSTWGSEPDVLQILRQTPTTSTYAFNLRSALIALDKSKIIKEAATLQKDTPEGKTQLTFLENHDLPRFASLQPDPKKQRLAALLLMTLPGTPILYYGQELGMKGLQMHGKTDGNDIPVRLAYRWGATLADKRTANWYAGTGPWAAPTYSKDHDGISLAEEADHPASLFNFYRRAIKLRLAHKAITDGALRPMPTNSSDLLEFQRIWKGRRITVVANLGDSVIDWKPKAGSLGTDLWSYRFDAHRIGAFGFVVAER